MSISIPLIAGGLLALTELAFSAMQPGVDFTSGWPERIAESVSAGLGGVLVSALVLLAATPHVGRSLLLTIAGTLAALAAVALLSRTSRRQP
jgi:hypothetical protein